MADWVIFVLGMAFGGLCCIGGYLSVVWGERLGRRSVRR